VEWCVDHLRDRNKPKKLLLDLLEHMRVPEGDDSDAGGVRVAVVSATVRLSML